MKKALAVLATLVAAGCAPYEGCNDVKPVVAEQYPAVVAPVIVEQTVPLCPCRQAPVVEAQVQNCGCALPDPCREVQRPRIKEVVADRPIRKCPADGQMINCGNGNQKTFVNEPAANVSGSREVVPAMPEAYVLASNRVVSRFLKDASSIYDKSPNIRLYVKPAKALSEDLPSGIDKSSENFKKQIASSYTFEIVDMPAEADYYLETTADWFDTPSKSVPAIEYKSVLYDQKNNKVKEWVEIIKRADNTKSWL